MGHNKQHFGVCHILASKGKSQANKNLKKDKKKCPQIQSNIMHQNDHSQIPKFDLKGERLRSILGVQSKKLEDTTRRENTSAHIEQRCSDINLVDNNHSLVKTSLVDQEVSNCI